MKRYFLIFSVFLTILCVTSCGEKKVIYNKGEYVGTGTGHEGPIKVKIATDKHGIKSIDILEEYEMPEISVHVYDTITKEIIKKNSTEVDTISGATYTSEGLIKAVEEALNKALREEDDS